MAKVLTLKFIDGSYKECEVTGRDMGGDDVFYMPLSALKPGRVDWGVDRTWADHHVDVLEVGKDYVIVEVRDRWGKHKGGPYKLYEGLKEGYSYMFGEWEYKFYVSIEWKDAE